MAAPVAAAGVIAAAPKIAAAAGAVGKFVSKAVHQDNVLMRTRDKIFSMFKAAGFGPGTAPLDNAVANQKMSHKYIPNRKVGKGYEEEWGRLYAMVIEVFIGMGRQDLADNFAMTVPQFTPTTHPIDYIATLLSGAGSKPAVQASANRYAVVEPLLPIMREALNAKGLHAPSNIEDATQLFYNTFVAKPGTDFEGYDFDDMDASMRYNVDDAVIEGVVAYVRNLMERKAQGEQLPKTLDKIAGAGTNVQNALVEGAKTEVKKEIGDWIIENKTWIIVGAVLIIGIIIFLVVRKK